MNIFFRTISKFAIPFIFLILGLTLIVMSVTKEEKKRVLCYTGAVDPGKTSLLEAEDLTYGDFPDMVKRNAELGIIIDTNFALTKVYKDTLNIIVDGLKNNTIDSARGWALKDSFYRLDTTMKVETNNLISEKNDVNSQINDELSYQNRLIKDGIVIQPKTFSQSKELLYGGIGVLLTSIIMFLFIANVISKQVTFILVPVFVVLAVIMIYKTFSSIGKLDNYDKARQRAYAETKVRLLDIRSGMLQYKMDKQKYPEDLDELIRFIKEDETYIVEGVGDVPTRPISAKEAFKIWGGALVAETDTTDKEAYENVYKKWSDTTYVAWGDSAFTERQAVYLGLIERDTVKKTVMEKLYTGPDVVRRRSDYAFSADSLKKMAYFDVPFLYNTKTIEEVSSKDSTVKKLYRFEVRLSEPMYVYNNDDACERRAELILGSLYEESTTGNWK